MLTINLSAAVESAIIVGVIIVGVTVAAIIGAIREERARALARAFRDHPAGQERSPRR